MRVLIFTYEFPPFKGGAGIYSRDLAVGLRTLGIEVHVLTGYAGDDGCQVNGVHIHILESNNTYVAQQRLCKLCIGLRFNIVLVTERRAQEDVARMPKGLFPYAVTLHGTEILDYFGSRRASLAVVHRRMAAFYERAGVCIAGSQATADLVGRVFPSVLRCVVVKYGIDRKRLPMAREEEVKSLRDSRIPSTKVVFCLGRLGLDKGQETLIRAFASVVRTCPEAWLLIGGIGPNRASLEALRNSLGLGECVEFVGEIPAQALPAYFALCEVFALTSKSENRWEGFGLVYLEAGHYGKPVIGGNEGGVPEAIAHMKSGVIVDPRDSDAVAASIITLLTDRDRARAMGEYGRQRVQLYFNAARMAQETVVHLQAASAKQLDRLWLTDIRLRLWIVRCRFRRYIERLYRLARRVMSWNRS